MKLLRCFRQNDFILNSHLFIFMAGPEELKPMQELLDKSKDVKVSISEQQVKSAFQNSTRAIDALEKKIQKQAEDQKLVPVEGLKSKNAEKISKLREQLKTLKTSLDNRLQEFDKKQKEAEKAAATEKQNALRQAIQKQLANGDTSGLSENGIKMGPGSTVILGYYRAMLAMGRGDEAYKNIVAANEKGGRDFGIFETKEVNADTLASVTGLKVNMQEYSFMNDYTLTRPEGYIQTFLKDAEERLKKDPAKLAQYKEYIFKTLGDDASSLKQQLIANTKESRSKRYGDPESAKCASKERDLIENGLLTPEKFAGLEAGVAKDAWKAAPTPAPQEKAAPAAPDTKPALSEGENKALTEADEKSTAALQKEITDAKTTMNDLMTEFERTIDTNNPFIRGTVEEKAAEKRQVIQKTFSQIGTLLNSADQKSKAKDFSGAMKDYQEAQGVLESTLKKEQESQSGEGALSDESKKVIDKIRKTIDVKTPAIKKAFDDKQATLKALGKAPMDSPPIGKTPMDSPPMGSPPSKGGSVPSGAPTSGPVATYEYPEDFVGPLPDGATRKKDPEKTEEQPKTLDRQKYANHLKDYIERLKLLLPVTSDPKEAQKIIDDVQKESDAAADPKQDFFPDKVAARVAYLDAMGKKSLKTYGDVLRKYAKEYPSIAQHLTDHAARFEKLAGESFATVNATELSNLVTFYKQQMDNIVAFQKGKAPPAPGGDGKGDKGGGGATGGGGGSGGAERGKTGVDASPDRARNLTFDFLNRQDLDLTAFGKLIKVENFIGVGNRAPSAEVVAGIKKLQKELGVTVDGIFGKKSLEALKVKRPADWEKLTGKKIDREDRSELPQALRDDLRDLEKMADFHNLVEEAKKNGKASNEYLTIEPAAGGYHRIIPSELLKQKVLALFQKYKVAPNEQYLDGLEIKYSDLKKQHPELLSRQQYEQIVGPQEFKSIEFEFDNKETTVVVDTFEDGTPMKDRLLRLPKDLQEKYNASKDSMVHANDVIRRQGINYKFSMVLVDGVGFHVATKNVDPTSNQNNAWSTDPEGKHVVKNMNMWLLERMEKRMKDRRSVDTSGAKVEAGPDVKLSEKKWEQILKRVQENARNSPGGWATMYDNGGQLNNVKAWIKYEDGNYTYAFGTQDAMGTVRNVDAFKKAIIEKLQRG